jgi:hypothetical protein
MPTAEPRIENHQLLLPSSRSIPLADIRLLAGEGGISLSGGEMLIWKKTHVITPTQRYTLRLSPAANTRFYTNLLQNCPQAVGIPYKGQLHLPQCPPNADPAEFLSSALTLTRRELNRQSLMALVFALLCLLAAIGLVALTITVAKEANPRNTTDNSAFKLGLWALIAFVLSALFLGRALYQRAHAARIAKTLRALQIT